MTLGIALVVITVVGIIVYPGGSDNFQGYLMRLTGIGTYNGGGSQTYSVVTAPTQSNSQCDSVNHWQDSSSSGRLKCICEDGYVPTKSRGGDCVVLDYCVVTDEQLDGYEHSSLVSFNTKNQITRTIRSAGGSLSLYKQYNCSTDYSLSIDDYYGLFNSESGFDFWR